MKQILCALSLLPSLAMAANLTDTSLLLTDQVKINGGKSFPLAAPPENKIHQWQTRTPHALKEEIVVSFPYENGILLDRIQAAARMEYPRNVELQVWNGKEWTAKGNAGSLNFSFKPAIPALAVKFICTGMGKRDHEPFYYNNWHIEGTAAGAKLPVGGYLTLTAKAKNNVFDLPSPVTADCTVTNPDKKADEFQTEIRYRNYIGETIAPRETRIFSLKPGEKRTLTAKYQPKQQGPVVVEVYLTKGRNRQLVAAEALLLGARDAKLASGETRPETFRSPAMERGEKVRSWTERHAADGALWGADATQVILFAGRRIQPLFFEKMEQAGAEILMTYLTHHDFEPLPGVYNFAAFDHMVKEAGKHHLGLEMGLWCWDFNGPSQFWLKDEAMRQRDGSVGNSWARMLSIFSGKAQKHSRRAVEVMVQRYQDAPEVLVWLPHPYGMVDHDGHGIFDFHPEALAAWKTYLRKKYGTIAGLNQVYGKDYADFAAVPVPEPKYRQLEREKAWREAVTSIDPSPAWEDYLDFYHSRLREVRRTMMEIVRANDTKRAVSGMNATGGVGHADATFADFARNQAFYGDQGINLIHYVRRLVAQRRYGLDLRHEDIAPVTIGRRDFTRENINDRVDWDMFQLTAIGVAHFNYVFTVWSSSPFWDRLFSNPRAKALCKEAEKMAVDTVPAGYLHSFTTDVRLGRYNYQGISYFRWWTMNAISAQMLKPGGFVEIFSDGCDLTPLAEMRCVFDDGSSVMPSAAVAALTDFVKNGGRLLIFNVTNEYTLGHPGEEYRLLRNLGYKDIAALSRRTCGNAEIKFTDGNGIFKKLKSLPVHDYSALTAPEGGKVLGTIGGVPAAVAWKYGQGEAVLLAGVPGVSHEPAVAALANEPDAGKRAVLSSDYWKRSEPELGAVWGGLLADWMAYSGIEPAYRLTGGSRTLMRKAPGKYMVYLYTEKEESPRLNLYGLSGRWRVTQETLDRRGDSYEVDGGILGSAGIQLGRLPAKRFMAVRLEKIASR